MRRYVLDTNLLKMVDKYIDPKFVKKIKTQHV